MPEDNKTFISAIPRDKDSSQVYINNTQISIQNSFINGSFLGQGQINQLAVYGIKN